MHLPRDGHHVSWIVPLHEAGPQKHAPDVHVVGDVTATEI